MHKILLPLAVSSALAVSSSTAYAFGVGADLGYAKVLNEGGTAGVGVDVYARPLPLPFIDPEIQVGMHRFSGDITTTVMPIMVGARLDLPVPVVSPWVGAHIGMVRTSVSGEVLGTEVSASEMSTGFNVGAGVNLLDLGIISVGVGAWYYIIMPPGDAPEGSENLKMLFAGVDASFGF